LFYDHEVSGYRRIESHGGEHRRCLLRGELDIPGALLKLYKNLLRPATAQSLAGALTLFEDTGAWRNLGFREKLPSNS